MWRRRLNKVRPHSSLGYLMSAAVAEPEAAKKPDAPSAPATGRIAAVGGAFAPPHCLTVRQGVIIVMVSVN